MTRAFSTIAFTPSVRRAQQRYGSFDANTRFESDPRTRDRIAERDHAFIENVETFFMASRGEGGWPYVQHRGGPRGFLKILDERTIGFVDYSGNRQYISAGNIDHDERVMLILMDYATRDRLKIWGRARIVHESDEPELMARLEVPAYRARVERAYVISIEALDFNCSQHITQRFSHEELARMAAEPEGRAMLSELLGNAPGAGMAPPAELGNGPLDLVVCGMRQLTPAVRAYTLRAAPGAVLPEAGPGAHLALPVRLAGNEDAVRHYSIVSAANGEWEVAVMRRDEDGGSAALQRHYQLGTVLHCALPRNDFPLHTDERPAILIAGGIGITPILPMAVALAARGAPFALHYAGRAREAMPYHDALPPRCTVYAAADGRRLDVDQVVAAAAQHALIYVCGPERLLEAVQAAAARHGLHEDQVRAERFNAPLPGAADKPVILELRRAGVTLAVPAGTSLLEAMEAAGVDVAADCRAGNCGTCVTKVLEGIPDHRDSVLSRSEREDERKFCPCVSRAHSERLVLDL